MRRKGFILAFFLVTFAFFWGQEEERGYSDRREVEEEKSGDYILRDILVEGGTKYSAGQVLKFSGLVKGESIRIPGQQLGNAIKKLWETNLFSQVGIYVQSLEGGDIVLRFHLSGLKELGEVKFRGKGIGKSKTEKFIKEHNLKSGTKISKDLVTKFKHDFLKQYTDKGFLDASIKIHQTPNEENPEKVDWLVEVDKAKRVKINGIYFEGNKGFSSSTLRGALKNTKQKGFFRVIKPSRFVKDSYLQDKKNLVKFYNSMGYRDFKIISDSLWRTPEGFNIEIKLDEGVRYRIGSIEFVGNSSYSTEDLRKVLGYKEGDIYDAVGFSKKVGEDGGEEDYSDIRSLYMNHGYLLADIAPIEKSVEADKVNLEIRIKEGEKATWNKVTWSGNTVTHDHVIHRSLRTLPGDLFSKLDIKRTFFDLAGMSYFDPQKIGQDIKPNPQDNTVDIHWTLVEKSSSQVQLQAGYGGDTFIGTLGLTLSNFSMRNFLRFRDFKPLPQGDGQVFSVQAQAGRFFESYGMSFTEPWLFGSRPTALSVGFNYSNMRYLDGEVNGVLGIFSANVGLNRGLNFPDNYFSLYTGISYQRYAFRDYPFQFGTETVNDGLAHNFSVNLGLSRNSAGPDPIFKTSGTDVELSLRLTPPYSLFTQRDYSSMSSVDKYKWLEFYKIKFKADAYNELVGKLVLRASMEMGFLDGYNRKLGAPPFERFYLGGTGLFGGRFDGRELIPLRGYESASSIGGSYYDVTPYGGATIYNRAVFELRYPVSMNQMAKVFVLGFLEGGNAWANFSHYNPFQMKRSVGFGIRVFMGAFGLLGFDFAYGIDSIMRDPDPSGWKTHFIMNQPL